MLVAFFAVAPVYHLGLCRTGVSLGCITWALGGLFKFTEKIGAVVGVIVGMFMPILMLSGFIFSEVKYPKLSSHNETCYQLRNTTIQYLTNFNFSQPHVLNITANEIDIGQLGFFSISFMCYPFIGCLTTIGVRVTVSLLVHSLSRREQVIIHPEYLCPMSKSCMDKKGSYTASSANDELPGGINRGKIEK